MLGESSGEPVVFQDFVCALVTQTFTIIQFADRLSFAYQPLPQFFEVDSKSMTGTLSADTRLKNQQCAARLANHIGNVIVVTA